MVNIWIHIRVNIRSNPSFKINRKLQEITHFTSGTIS